MGKPLTLQELFTSLNLSPAKQDLWFLPLGGTGEIGMNMNLYGHDEHWLMVDCGVMFDEPLVQGDAKKAEIVSADPSFIAAHKEQLSAMIVTHAHEDHVGAAAYLWPRLRCPIYTTAFTAACLRKKLAEKNLLEQVTIVEVAPGSSHTIGPFEVQWIQLTHSIPEPQAIVIRTKAGTVFHTGDWKIDYTPVIGSSFDPEPLKALGLQDIQAVICDSTNALRQGRTPSESECKEGLTQLVSEAKGRVVVACFASNIARLLTLAQVARETGRYISLLGRSLENMVSRARETDYWPQEYGLSDPHHMGYLPPEEVLVVATGSQGEPKTALHRLAMKSHRLLELEPGDTVIFSSMIIPGNEDEIEKLVGRLKSQHIKVIQSKDSDLPIHASGHPSASDLEELYRWTRPKIVIPTHGEAQHLQANAQIAKQSGVSRQLTGLNGDLFYLSGTPGIRKNAVAAARIALKR